MDIRLPVLDGHDAIGQTKALLDTATIPIIAVSSFAMKRDEEKERVAARDDEVTKPLRPNPAVAPSPYDCELVNPKQSTSSAKVQRNSGLDKNALG